MQRRGRYSSTWLQDHTTCLQQGEQQTAQKATIDDVATATNAIDLLHGLSANNFENTPENAAANTRIANLVTTDETFRTTFMNASGIPFLTHFMAVNIDSTCAQRTSCNTLYALATHSNDDVQTALSDAEAVEAVIDILKTHAEDPSLQVAASKTLHALSACVSLCVHMATDDVLQPLAMAFHTAVLHPEVVTHLANTFATVASQHKETRMTLGKAGVVEDMASALQKQSHSKEVTTAVIGALASLLEDCDENKDRFQTACGMDGLLSAMSVPGLEKQVVMKQFFVLKAILSHSEAERQKVIEGTEWLDRLIQLSDASINDLDVFQQGVDVLNMLCRHDMKRERLGATNIGNSLLKHGASLMCLNGMKRALAEKRGTVLKHVCELRRLLMLSFDFRIASKPQMVDCMHQVIKTTTLALSVFKDDADIVAETVDLQCAIIAGHDDCKEKFIEDGAVQGIVDIMKRYRKDERLNTICCKVLDYAAEGQLATAPTLLKGKEIAVEAILTSMADFSECGALAESACSLLIKVAAISPEDTERLIASGARTMVQMAQSKHVGNAAIESLANQLLLLLVDGSNETAGGEGSGPRAPKGGLRVRSRSRMIEDSESVRARAQKSRSPVRVHKSRRASRERRMAAAKANVGAAANEGIVGSRVRVRRAARQKLSLEPVFE